MTKKIVSRKEVKHWLGNDYKDWIDDCIYRLMNNQISSIDSHSFVSNALLVLDNNNS